MGVMLRPNEDPMPTEEELARLAGLVPGDIDRKHLEELRRNLDEKGFMVTTAEDLFTWARHGLAVVDDVRPRLLRGRDDPREHASIRS